MSRYQLTESASDDLREIVAYLAEHAGEETSLRVEDGLFVKFASLAEYPGQGHSRTDLTPLPLLFFTVDPYLIVYQRDASLIVLHAVFQGARDVQRHLRHRTIKISCAFAATGSAGGPSRGRGSTSFSVGTKM